MHPLMRQKFNQIGSSTSGESSDRSGPPTLRLSARCRSRHTAVWPWIRHKPQVVHVVPVLVDHEDKSHHLRFLPWHADRIADIQNITTRPGLDSRWKAGVKQRTLTHAASERDVCSKGTHAWCGHYALGFRSVRGLRTDPTRFMNWRIGTSRTRVSGLESCSQHLLAWPSRFPV